MNGFVYSDNPLGLSEKSNRWGNMKTWFNETVLPVLNYQIGRFGKPDLQIATGISPQLLLGGVLLYLVAKK